MSGISVKDKAKILDELASCLERAKSNEELVLPNVVKSDVDQVFNKLDLAKSGYTNLLTCLVCSAIDPLVDPRYHREPGGKADTKMPEPNLGDKWFSGRTISEKVLVEWMRHDTRGFRVANSGWQTRTYERPKPYTLDYSENISHIKSEFLRLLDFANNNRDKSSMIISYCFRKEMKFIGERGELKSNMAKNNVGNRVPISQIIKALEEHFNVENSSYLPVVAVHSIYQLIVNEFDSYRDLSLKPMDHHNSADARTGTIGDIEIVDKDGTTVEAVEVKHNIKINSRITQDARGKILSSNVKRYYILTTHSDCKFIDSEMEAIIEKVYLSHGCQTIVNGVFDSIKYYLRLVSEPSDFLKCYKDNLLKSDDVTMVHLKKWEEIELRF